MCGIKYAESTYVVLSHHIHLTHGQNAQIKERPDCTGQPVLVPKSNDSGVSMITVYRAFKMRS